MKRKLMVVCFFALMVGLFAERTRIASYSEPIPMLLEKCDSKSLSSYYCIQAIIDGSTCGIFQFTDGKTNFSFTEDEMKQIFKKFYLSTYDMALFADQELIASQLTRSVFKVRKNFNYEFELDDINGANYFYVLRKY